MKPNVFLICLLLAASASLAQKKSKKDYLITINTNFGDMHLVLHDQTPLHKANFLSLVQRSFYDSLLFHRVIEQFMIQGGDPDSKKAQASTLLGGGGGATGRIPAEFVPALFHKKGALAAARDNNPEKQSSGCQFYIVQGKVYNDSTLNIQAKRAIRKPSDQQQEIYKTIGGVPHLDGNYTVFGQLIAGFEVLDSIAHQTVDPRTNRPTNNIAMKITAKLMRKKKITKKFGYQF